MISPILMAEWRDVEIALLGLTHGNASVCRHDCGWCQKGIFYKYFQWRKCTLREQRKGEEEGRIRRKMVSYLNPCHREHRSDRGARQLPLITTVSYP